MNGCPVTHNNVVIQIEMNRHSLEPFHRNVNLSLKKLMLSSRLKFGIVLKVVENAIQNEFKF